MTKDELLTQLANFWKPTKTVIISSIRSLLKNL